MPISPKNWSAASAHPEIVDFGSRQGRSMGIQIPNRVNSRIRDRKERAIILLDKFL
jgi:hypothetical protein